MSNPWWKSGFGSVLPNTCGVAFGDLAGLEAELKSKKYAAFITEPVQGESGVIVPPPGYLQSAKQLCERYGTLFVLDEVQTGLFRTGKFLAAQHFEVEPDMVIIAKALSGGFVPVGALLMTTEINESVYSSIDRAFVHASTFGENALAMRAGLATLDLLESEKLGENAELRGAQLRSQINKLAANFEMLKEARGLGLMTGIEFVAPESFGLRLLYAGFNKCHQGLFGQMVVKHLFENARTLTQMCGNNYTVIKACPPLTISEHEITRFTENFEQLLLAIHSERGKFWKQGLAIAMRAFSPA